MYIVQSIHIWERVQDEKKQERQKCSAGTRQTDGKNWGLVWRNRKKISQIIKVYFHLPFFLLIILWLYPKQISLAARYIKQGSVVVGQSWTESHAKVFGGIGPWFFSLYVLQYVSIVYCRCYAILWILLKIKVKKYAVLRIRCLFDPGIRNMFFKDSGFQTGIRDKHPRSATLKMRM